MARKKEGKLAVTPMPARRVGSIEFTITVNFDIDDPDAVEHACSLLGEKIRAVLPFDGREHFIDSMNEATDAHVRSQRAEGVLQFIKR